MLILLDSDYLTWHFWLQLFLTQYVNSVDLPVRRWNPTAGLMTSLYIQCDSCKHMIHLPSSKKRTPRGMSYEVNRRSVYASASLEILGYIKACPNCFVWNEGDYGNVSLACGSYLLGWDVRHSFVCLFLWSTYEAVTIWIVLCYLQYTMVVQCRWRMAMEPGGVWAAGWFFNLAMS